MKSLYLKIIGGVVVLALVILGIIFIPKINDDEVINQDVNLSQEDEQDDSLVEDDKEPEESTETKATEESTETEATEESTETKATEESTETEATEESTETKEPEGPDPKTAKVIGPKEQAVPYDDEVGAIVGMAKANDVENAEDFTYERILDLIREAVSYAGGLEGIVENGDVVVLKPNLVKNTDETLPGGNGKPLNREVNGVITDWRVVKAVAALVREINPDGKIYVMEGAAERSTTAIYKLYNYTTEKIPEVNSFYAIEDVSGTWRNKNSELLIEVESDENLLHNSYFVNRFIYNADVYIDIPTFKNHSNAAMTGGIKNIGIGATPANIYGNTQVFPQRGTMVNHMNDDLHKWISDYYSACPADFVITDGLQGVQYGPTPSYAASGVTSMKDAQMNMRMILASNNTLACDTVQTNLMNWDYETINQLLYVEDRGLGTTDASKITVVSNTTVMKERKDFKGTEPSNGGKKLTDKTPPILENAKLSIDDNDLILTYKTDDTSVKTEIWNGTDLIYVTNDIEKNKEMIDISALDKGDYKFTVITSDKYFNSTEKVFDVEKTSSKGGADLVYVGGFNKKIGLYTLEKENLELIEEYSTTYDPTFLAFHPQKNVLYAGQTDMNKMAMSAYEIDSESGKLTLISEKSGVGGGLCHITATDKAIYGACYFSGHLLAYSLDENGAIGDMLTQIKHTKGSTHAQQQSARGHQVVVDPSGERLIYVDLGGDIIYTYPINNDGSLDKSGVIESKLPSAQGPRHLIISDNGSDVYLLTELGNKVFKMTYKEGVFTQVKSVSILEGNNSNGANAAGEIAFSPDKKQIFCTARGEDKLVVFDLDLNLVDRFSVEGKHPRMFSVTPEYIMVANKDSNSIDIFDAKTYDYLSKTQVTQPSYVKVK